MMRAQMDRVQQCVWLATAAALIGLCAAATCPAYMNHDAAWYLHMSSVWLDGGVLYRDVIDTNPPLIVFLSTLPVAMARGFNIGGPAAFKAFVFIVAVALGSFAVVPLLRTWERGSSRLVMITTVAFALFPFVGSDFGQREHFAAMLTLPFVLSTCNWVAGRARGGLLEMAAGALGGLGFALKPHFSVAWIAIELCTLLLRPRSWRRPAAVAALITILLYAAIVLFFVPDYLQIAREVLQVYGGLNAPFSVLARLGDLRVWGLALVAMALTPAIRQREPVLVLFAASTGFLIAALVQLKGWGYQFYPFRVFVLLYFAALAAALADPHWASTRVMRGRILAGLVVLVAVVWSARWAVSARRAVGHDHVAALLALLHHHEPVRSLAVLSMRNIVYPAFPVVNYTQARWVLRHNSLWFLPGLYADELSRTSGPALFRPIVAMPPLERQYFDQIVGDLCAHPPDVLIVEPPVPTLPAGGRSLDLLPYYRQDPGFNRLFTAYSPIGRAGPFAVFAASAGASCGY